MTRSDEIRALLNLSPGQVQQRAGQRLHVLPTLDALHAHMADSIAADIAAHQSGEPLRIILPVGPVDQYPLLVERIAAQKLSLRNVWFFFMDEYCDAEGRALPASHPLSFKGAAQRLFLDRLPAACGLKPDQVLFPDEQNVQALATAIPAMGGIHVCYGGIGIHGHVAFNEPDAGVMQMGVRKVRLHDFTVTINALRAGVGGNLHNFPREAYTLGMTEIFAANRIRLYCRSGPGMDWAKTILRVALLGTPDDDYPVTHLQTHPDFMVMTDADTLAGPQHVI